MRDRSVLTWKRIVVPMTIGIASCTGQPAESNEVPYGEAHRPQFHFSPPTAWMNDPNGMVFFNGEYHLFYQHYPEATVWGPMHWGHAVSRDLVRWEHLPIALYPDSLGYIFSGSAVVDWNNSAGFQVGDSPALVAIFTQHDTTGERRGAVDFQTQGIAFSNDNGRTWTKYRGNPVLPNPGIRDFRDPKVIWHPESQQWVMVLAAGNHVRFHGSPDLKSWRFLSEFGSESGNHGGVWECPDIFVLDGPNDTERWVLLVSINPGAPNGGSGTQYFLGHFDGTTFMNDNPPSTELWLDWGRDNYAGVTWSDVPESDGRRLFIGWNSNWDYAQVVPTERWRSAMTLPRELALVDSNDGLRVASRPVVELERLRGQAVSLGQTDIDSSWTIRDFANASQFEALIDVAVSDSTANVFGIELANRNGDRYRFGIDRATRLAFSDRTASGLTRFSERFAESFHTAPYDPPNGHTRLHVYVDRSSVEVFVDDGVVVMTELFFPATPYEQVRLFSRDGTATVIRADFFPIASIWY